MVACSRVRPTITSIFLIAQRILGQGRRVILNWIPSHTNSQAYQVVEPLNDMIIKPNSSLLNRRVEAAGYATRPPSSVRWDGDATQFEHLPLSALRSRGAEVIMHRLSLCEATH